MKIAETMRYLAACAFAFALVACEKEHTADVERAADFFAARMLDTTSLDSLAEVPYDSASIDSLVDGWTAGDWQHFWERVENKRAEAAKAAAEAQKDSTSEASDD